MREMSADEPRNETANRRQSPERTDSSMGKASSGKSDEDQIKAALSSLLAAEQTLRQYTESSDALVADDCDAMCAEVSRVCSEHASVVQALYDNRACLVAAFNKSREQKLKRTVQQIQGNMTVRVEKIMNSLSECVREKQTDDAHNLQLSERIDAAFSEFENIGVQMSADQKCLDDQLTLLSQTFDFCAFYERNGCALAYDSHQREDELQQQRKLDAIEKQKRDALNKPMPRLPTR